MAKGGLIIPTPTLFGPKGELDPERNARFIAELCDQGIDHVFTLGSLGEFPSLAPSERKPLLRAVIDATRRGADVWVGCGAPSTPQAVEFAREAQEAGAAALVVVPPFYLHPTEEAIGRYYRALRAASDLPLFAYNIPSLVGYALRPGFLHGLGSEGILQGVKDTNGALSSVLEHLRGAPQGYAVIPGDDEFATDAILSGAAGAVMGTGNVLPKTAFRLVHAALDGDEPKARENQAVIDRLVTVLHAGPFPSTGKYLGRRLRGTPDGYRSPYDPLSPEEERRVLAALVPHEAEFRRSG
jgi:4-hydroxy-tetrahydrodipicolinate synthase